MFIEFSYLLVAVTFVCLFSTKLLTRVWIGGTFPIAGNFLEPISTTQIFGTNFNRCLDDVTCVCQAIWLKKDSGGGSEMISPFNFKKISRPRPTRKPNQTPVVWKIHMEHFKFDTRSANAYCSQSESAQWYQIGST